MCVVWAVLQAPYGWPAALGLTPPTAGGLFAEHQASSALGAKVAAADATNRRSPDLQQRLHLCFARGVLQSLTIHYNIFHCFLLHCVFAAYLLATLLLTPTTVAGVKR